MNPMHVSPIYSVPLSKRARTENTSTPRKSSQMTLASSPLPNIVQRIRYELTENGSRPHALAAKKFSQPNEAITVINFENAEILVVNAPANEIRSWSQLPIPYRCFPVRNTDEQQTTIDRTIAALSTLKQLPQCAVGVEVDLEKCNNLDSQLQDVDNFKQAIWLFLLNEVKLMPPHLKQCIKTDLKNLRSTDKRQKPPLVPPAFNLSSSPFGILQVNAFCITLTSFRVNNFLPKPLFQIFFDIRHATL